MEMVVFAENHGQTQKAMLLQPITVCFNYCKMISAYREKRSSDNMLFHVLPKQTITLEQSWILVSQNSYGDGPYLSTSVSKKNPLLRCWMVENDSNLTSNAHTCSFYDWVLAWRTVEYHLKMDGPSYALRGPGSQ